jgi:aspartyl-tRNA synthetase
MHRTHTCGELRPSHIGKTVTLSGWVHRRRDHGGLIFIDLRDRYGLTQIAFDPNVNKEALAKAEEVRSEFVLKVTGEVKARPEGQNNDKMATGEIEVYIKEIEILNPAKTPPFEIDQETVHNEEVRLKYRYLDLRHERLQRNLILRHQMIKTIRDYFDANQFIEVETPILIKGTPEGSREYLVPSRLYAGKFYVLPQSPQQLKQLLMVSGFDRYFQIARCFRDEDQRGDRQPEFTQLDVEMSFISEEDIRALNEKCFIDLTKKFAPGKKILSTPFPVLTYQEAMERFGSDKPDIRFGMELKDVSETVKGCEFKVFNDALKNGGVIKALCVQGGGKFTRSEIDSLTELAKTHGAKGLAYFVYENGESSVNGIKSPIRKFLSDAQAEGITKITGAKEGDIVFFGADSFDIACEALGQVRLACADKLNLRDPNVFAYLWVHEFPMFEKDKETGGLAAKHHPFTRPMSEDQALLDSAPEKARAVAYDIVLNGSEVGGGSLRIHESDLQSKIFKILGITAEQAEARFGHMLEAFTYGAPPHGGIAWGLDRLVMIFAGEPNIREVMAFPKDSKAKDLMLGAPSQMPEKQVEEANVKIINTEE